MSGYRDYPPVPDPLGVPLYDNHTHLEPHGDTMDPLGATMDPLEQLDRATDAGVRGVVQVGTDLASSRWSADLAEQDERVLAAVALHPDYAAPLDAAGLLDDHIAGIAALSVRPRVRAIGETGLDFFHTGEDGRAAQVRSFEAHIALAKEHDLALQIHNRDAHREVIDTLRRVGAPERTVFHCFSGDAEFARVVAEGGWYLSFAGTVTFKNAPALREALATAPPSQVLVETDAPYLTPMPWRGRTNSSYLISHTVRFMAELLEVDVEDFARQLAENTERVYGTWGPA